MTREEAQDVLQKMKLRYISYDVDDSDEARAVDMAIEALEQPEVKCLKCDSLKSCMHAWDVNCGCEFFKVNGVHPREEEK